MGAEGVSVDMLEGLITLVSDAVSVSAVVACASGLRAGVRYYWSIGEEI